MAVQAKCELCETEVVRYPIMGLCTNCYRYLWYWKQRTLKDQMKRKRKVELFHKRLETVTGVRVARHTRARKRA